MTKEENRRRTAVAIASRIKTARKAQGMTLYRLSKETGITEGHLSKIEAGEIAPRVDMLQKIIEALQVCVSFPLG